MAQTHQLEIFSGPYPPVAPIESRQKRSHNWSERADWLKEELNSGFGQSLDVHELHDRQPIYKCMRIALESVVGKNSIKTLKHRRAY